MAEKTVDQPINHKTCVLKASIHCEGCKRKVKKILSQVHGVTFVDVDTKLQKVTITVSGNVEADVLINKLVKAGKHAELWPEKVVEKFPGFGKSREKLAEKTQSKTEIDRQQTKTTSDINAGKAIDPSGKVESVQNPASSSSVIENGEKTGGTAKADEGGAEKGNEANGGVTSGKVEVVIDASMKSSSSSVQETESVGKKKVEDSSAGGEPPKAAEKGHSTGVNEVGSSTAGKKKKKKGQNGNLATTLPSSAAAPGGSGPENHEPSVPIPTNQIDPRHQDHPYVPPNNFYVPPASVYGVSYNTAYPPSSYTASYYATPPPYSYAYTYPGQENEPPPSDPESHRQRTLDSFELFSDENPNGCTIA